MEGSGGVWISCGVHVAGVKEYWGDLEDSVKLDVRLSDSVEGVPLRVLGTKRCSSSLSLVAMGWRAVSLDQSTSSVS